MNEDRKNSILSIRALNLSRSRNARQQRELPKNYKHTSEYVHLTLQERRSFLSSVAVTIDSWKDAVLFAEAQDKTKAQLPNAFDVAFEQVVTRFNDRVLWERIKGRIDKSGDRLVVIRHYTGRTRCTCEICREHGRCP